MGAVPAVYKSAYVTPLLKKADMDPADKESYRPISSLSVLSKLLERLVTRQLLEHLNAAMLLPHLQSAYRAYHSMETAVLKVLADIIRALDTGDLAVNKPGIEQDFRPDNIQFQHHPALPVDLSHR